MQAHDICWRLWKLLRRHAVRGKGPVNGNPRKFGSEVTNFIVPRAVNVLLSAANKKGYLTLAGVEGKLVAPTQITLAMTSCMGASATPVLREATA